MLVSMIERALGSQKVVDAAFLGSAIGLCVFLVTIALKGSLSEGIAARELSVSHPILWLLCFRVIGWCVFL